MATLENKKSSPRSRRRIWKTFTMRGTVNYMNVKVFSRQKRRTLCDGIGSSLRMPTRFLFDSLSLSCIRILNVQIQIGQLNNAVGSSEAISTEISNCLDQIDHQQKQFEAELDWLEEEARSKYVASANTSAAGGGFGNAADEERQRVYELAEETNKDLMTLSRELGLMIEEVNKDWDATDVPATDDTVILFSLILFG